MRTNFEEGEIYTDDNGFEWVSAKQADKMINSILEAAELGRDRILLDPKPRVGDDDLLVVMNKTLMRYN